MNDNFLQSSEKQSSEILLQELKESAKWVERGLKNYFNNLNNHPRLSEYAEYSLKAGGKRIRPFLVRSSFLSCCPEKDFASDTDACLAPAMAVEMIHTYSLIHDDLPCMDDDELRRGKPALHIIAGSSQAALTGDWLLVEAFRVLLSSNFSPGRNAEMINRLASAAGPAFLAGGQYRDLFPPEDPDMKWVELVQLGKTAAMIRVSMELGVISSDLIYEKILPDVSRIGNRFGVLFQLTDDILDKTSSTEKLGKTAAKDSAQGKATQVDILGIRESIDLAVEIADDIVNECGKLPGDWSRIAGLAAFLPERSS